MLLLFSGVYVALGVVFLFARREELSGLLDRTLPTVTTPLSGEAESLQEKA